MEEWFRWIGGLAVTVLIAAVSIMINTISKLQAKQSADTATLHGRIDGVKEGYVRRDDFREFRAEISQKLSRLEEKSDEILKQTRQH